MGYISETFDYVALKELLKDTKAEILLPGDGQNYEDIIQRWSESCVKRAVRYIFCFILSSRIGSLAVRRSVLRPEDTN